MLRSARRRTDRARGLAHPSYNSWCVMSTPKLKLEQEPYSKSVKAELYSIHNVNAFEWMKQQPLNSIHAVVTDPPYGLLEYTEKELVKMKSGRGGVWRIPPAFDGAKRRPLPRFTVLTGRDKLALRRFFTNFRKLSCTRPTHGLRNRPQGSQQDFGKTETSANS